MCSVETNSMPSHILNMVWPQTMGRKPSPCLVETQKPVTGLILHQHSLSSTMDIFHHGKEKRLSMSGKSTSGGKNSPKLAPFQPVRLAIDMESPPLVSFGPPSSSTGALLSGQLILTVTGHAATLKGLKMRLLANVTTKKPVAKDCPECTVMLNELFSWNFLTEPATYTPGTHSLPFSYLLPGHLPATSHSRLGTIEYILSANGTCDLSENIKVERTLVLQRALAPGTERNSVRIFPPTNLAANIVIPPVIHPIGEFNVQMRMTGVADAEKDHQRRWRLRKMSWRIEEKSKIVSPACPKHAHKVGGGEGKGILHQDTKVIGADELKDGWKTDFNEIGGSIEMEFVASIKPGMNPVCDVESPAGFSVAHGLVIELIVAEEFCSSKHSKSYTPTGSARVLRMQFSLVMTERLGMGISWDEEQPPTYEDVPISPPSYAKMDDYEGEPIPYEHLDDLMR